MQKPTRVHRIGAAALLVCLAGCGCGGEPEAAPAAAPEPSPEVEAPAAVIPQAPRPTHGGTVVDLGAYFVEVLTRDASAVDVLTLGDDRPDPGQTYATVWLTGPDGALHPVVLTWDPVGERYRGLLRGVLPIPGPIRVAMVTGAERRSGEASTLVVSGAPSAGGGSAGVSAGGRRSAVATPPARSNTSPADTNPARRARETASAAARPAADAPAARAAPVALEPPSESADALHRAAASPTPTLNPTPTTHPPPTPSAPTTPPPRATVRVLSGPRTPPAGGRPQLREQLRDRPARPPAGAELRTETRQTGRQGASVRPR